MIYPLVTVYAVAGITKKDLNKQFANMYKFVKLMSVDFF